MKFYFNLKKIIGNKIYHALLISLLLFFTSILEIVGIGLFIPLLGFLLDDNKVTFYSQFIYSISNYLNFSNPLVMILTLIFFFIVLKNIILYLITSYINGFLVNLFRFLSTKFLKSYINLPYSFFLNNSTSKIIQNININTTNFVFILMKSSLILISDIFLLFGFSIVLAFISPEVFIMTFLLLLIFIFFYLLIQNKNIKNTSSRIHTLEVYKISLIQQIFRSIRDFKLSVFQKDFIKVFDKISLNLSSFNRKYLNFLAIPKLILETFVVLIFVIIFLFLLYLEKSKSEILTIMGIYTLCFFRLMPIVSSFLRNSQDLKFFSESINQLLIIQTEIKNNLNINVINNHSKIKLKKNKFMNFSKIIFKNVNFSYDDKNVIFKNLNFEIKIGEKIGILGKSGTGKTTFVDLLVGLLNPQSGTVNYDKADIKYNFNSIRGNIGYVTQNVFLSENTIVDNIAFGEKKNKINFSKINNLVKALDLSDFINSQEKKLYTLVGEGGAKLSGGQRQRLGIARALYRNPRLVIFDEATSALDSKTEETIMKNLNSIYFKNTTLVMISHRAQTLKYCDKLFSLKNFKLIKHF
jgi:ABC-type bacteriocin/lantibiotic exporter with double-glycine peptidase domain